MANTTNTRARKSTTQRTGTVKAKPEPTVKAEPEASKTRIIPKEVDPNQYVIVRNGFQGKLVYISPRTGERFSWDSFGDEQEMELRELRNVKSSCKKLFENNWFMFDDEDSWVVDYLGIRQYYKNSLNIDNFDSVFSLTPEEIKKTITPLSKGLKKSIAYRARQLLSEGEIDSRKSIAALEESLDIELIEK